jgi:chorismate synthase
LRGNSFGQLFTITTFGESHGEALGVVIDGISAGLSVDLKELQNQLDRRRPGRLEVSTSRNEADKAEILSGVFDSKTLGTPICVIVRNTNQKSKDYDSLKTQYRPGHADQTTMDKFGYRDHRGGGRASGRETLARVIAGYFASLLIPNIKFKALITQIANFKESESLFSFDNKSVIGFIDESKDQEIKDYLLDLKSKGESAGGKVRCVIQGCPKGLGEPVFAKLKSELSSAMLGIGSCMGISFGLGEHFASTLGTQISQDSKNFSGIEGGISNGEDIYFDLVFKAPSTVGEKALEGRHDPCILPRVLPVVESMAKIVIADQFLRQNAFQN